MIGLLKRNIKCFLSNKATIFYSFLTAAIYIVISFVLFNNQYSNADFKNFNDIVNYYIIGNLLCIGLLSSCISNMLIYVSDKKIIYRDFCITPVKRYQILLSYIISDILISFTLYFLIFIGYLFYVKINGSLMLELSTIIKVSLLLIVLTTSFTTIIFSLFSFIINEKTFGIITALASSIVGFLMGVYIPITLLSGFIYKMVVCFPLTHGVIMIRKVIIGDLVKGYPQFVQTKILDSLGVNIYFNDHYINFMNSFLILVIFSLFCFLISTVAHKLLGK